MRADEQIHLLDNLQGLLEEQIKMARKGNFRRVEALAEQAGGIVEKIAETRVLERPEFSGQREYLAKLYNKLELIIASNKVNVARQVQQVGNGRKIIQAYSDNG